MSLFRVYVDGALFYHPQMSKLSYLEAILCYAFEERELPMTPNAAASFILVRPNIESSRKLALARKKGGVTAQARAKEKAAAQKQLSDSSGEAETQVEEEEDRDKEEKVDVEEEADQKKKETPAPAKKYGEYGRVLLTDDQFQKLMKDLGEAELQRCIRYVDEAAQQTGNKNKWKDWNITLRKCSREGWGRYPNGRRNDNGPLENAADLAAEAARWNIHYD